jgi:hypothetical protein
MPSKSSPRAALIDIRENIHLVRDCVANLDIEAEMVRLP